jgi:hypothetical protein
MPQTSFVFKMLERQTELARPILLGRRNRIAG